MVLLYEHLPITVHLAQFVSRFENSCPKAALGSLHRPYPSVYGMHFDHQTCFYELLNSIANEMRALPFSYLWKNSENNISTKIHFYCIYVFHHKGMHVVAPTHCNAPDGEQQETQAGESPIVVHIGQVRLLR